MPGNELMALLHCAGRVVEGTWPAHRATKKRNHGLDREQDHNSAAHQLDMNQPQRFSNEHLAMSYAWQRC